MSSTATTFRDSHALLDVVHERVAERIEARRVVKLVHLPPLSQSATYFLHEPGRDVAGGLLARGARLVFCSNVSDERPDRAIGELIRPL